MVNFNYFFLLKFKLLKKFTAFFAEIRTSTVYKYLKLLAIDCFFLTRQIVPKEKSKLLAQNKASKIFDGVSCDLSIVEISMSRQVVQYYYYLLNNKTRLLFRI